MYRKIGKRSLDFLVVIPALFLLLPLAIVVAVFVRLLLGSPILFQQKRPGLNGRPFTILKFRTMTNMTDASGDLLPDAQRLTRFGRFLRSTSLDELPELINVLKGEMSLVGPRPLLMRYLDLYTPDQMRRHEALPGITGWAQVNGRNAISWEEKFELDVWYVDNMSLWLDVKTLVRTLLEVVKREGISQPGAATMTAFEGTQRSDRGATSPPLAVLEND